MRAHQVCGHTPVATIWAQLPPTDAWWHAMAVQHSFLIFQRQTDHELVYKKGWSSFSTHTIIWSQAPHYHLLYSFSFSSTFCEQGKSYLESLSPWKKKNLGMNIVKSSSKALLSYHLYSSAYELEYSCLIIIMIYELVYSLCRLILLLFFLLWLKIG